MTATIPPPPTSAPIISDTGFLLSVAATTLLLPILEERWNGRAKWPRAVQSELHHRISHPGNGVSVELAKRALACGIRLAGKPIDLDEQQQVDAERLAIAIGGFGTLGHAGEVAGAVLARDLGGYLACEDISACVVIQAREGVRSITIRTLLWGLHRNGTLTREHVEVILRDLVRHGRPNVDGLTVDAIVEG